MYRISKRFQLAGNPQDDMGRSLAIFINISVLLNFFWLFIFTAMLASGTLFGNYGDLAMPNIADLLMIGMVVQVLMFFSAMAMSQLRVFGYYGLLLGYLVNIYLGASFDFLFLLTSLGGLLGMWFIARPRRGLML